MDLNVYYLNKTTINIYPVIKKKQTNNSLLLLFLHKENLFKVIHVMNEYNYIHFRYH